MILHILILSAILSLLITASYQPKSSFYYIHVDSSTTTGSDIQANNVFVSQESLTSSLDGPYDLITILINYIQNGVDHPDSPYSADLDAEFEIVNRGYLSFKNGSNITAEEFEDFTRKVTKLPFFLDPFCKSILQAFLDKHELVLPFYNFFFNGFTHIFKDFDPEEPHSWDFLINFAFKQFLNGTGNGSCVCEIIENLVVPSYQTLANYSFNFDYERFKDQQNLLFEDFSISAYLEEVVLDAFIHRLRRLLFYYQNDVDARVHFKILFWEASNDISIRSKIFNYHCEFLMNIHFKHLRTPKFRSILQSLNLQTQTQVEPFLESLASNIYTELEKASSYQDIIYKVFPSAALDDISDAVNYSEIIEICQRTGGPLSENRTVNPFLWDPDKFSVFLGTVVNDIIIMSALTNSEICLLESLQAPTHTFTYFLLQNFYEATSIDLFFVRSLIYSAYNQYSEMLNGCVGCDFKEFNNSFLFQNLTLQIEVSLTSLQSQRYCIDMVRWNHLASIKAFFAQVYISAVSASKVFEAALTYERVEIAKYLLRQRNIITTYYVGTFFCNAIERGDIEIVREFLEQRKDICYSDLVRAFRIASQKGFVAIVKLILVLRSTDDFVEDNVLPQSDSPLLIIV